MKKSKQPKLKKCQKCPNFIPKESDFKYCFKCSLLGNEKKKTREHSLTPPKNKKQKVIDENFLEENIIKTVSLEDSQNNREIDGAKPEIKEKKEQKEATGGFLEHNQKEELVKEKEEQKEEKTGVHIEHNLKKEQLEKKEEKKQKLENVEFNKKEEQKEEKTTVQVKELVEQKEEKKVEDKNEDWVFINSKNMWIDENIEKLKMIKKKTREHSLTPPKNKKQKVIDENFLEENIIKTLSFEDKIEEKTGIEEKEDEKLVRGEDKKDQQIEGKTIFQEGDKKDHQKEEIIVGVDKKEDQTEQHKTSQKDYKNDKKKEEQKEEKTTLQVKELVFYRDPKTKEFIKDKKIIYKLIYQISHKDFKISAEKMNKIPAGIYNRYNWCYLISVINSLYQIDIFRNFIIKIGDKSKTGFNKIIASIFKDMNKKTYPISITNLTDRIKELDLVPNEQQDAHELFVKLFDKIENELQRIDKKESIFNLFGSIIASEISTSSGYKFINLEQNLFVSVSTSESIEKSIMKYFEQEKNDEFYFNEITRNKEIAQKKMDLICHPEILVVHVLRYLEVSKEKFVKYSKNLEFFGMNYKLSSFICHIGRNIYSGHYICYIIQNNKFIELNDAHVKEIPEEDFFNKNAYLLFYIKDNNNLNNIALEKNLKEFYKRSNKNIIEDDERINPLPNIIENFKKQNDNSTRKLENEKESNSSSDEEDEEISTIEFKENKIIGTMNDKIDMKNLLKLIEEEEKNSIIKFSFNKKSKEKYTFNDTEKKVSTLNNLIKPNTMKINNDMKVAKVKDVSSILSGKLQTPDIIENDINSKDNINNNTRMKNIKAIISCDFIGVKRVSNIDYKPLKWKNMSCPFLPVAKILIDIIYENNITISNDTNLKNEFLLLTNQILKKQNTNLDKFMTEYSKIDGFFTFGEYYESSEVINRVLIDDFEELNPFFKFEINKEFKYLNIIGQHERETKLNEFIKRNKLNNPVVIKLPQYLIWNKPPKLLTKRFIFLETTYQLKYLILYHGKHFRTIKLMNDVYYLTDEMNNIHSRIVNDIYIKKYEFNFSLYEIIKGNETISKEWEMTWKIDNEEIDLEKEDEQEISKIRVKSTLSKNQINETSNQKKSINKEKINKEEYDQYLKKEKQIIEEHINDKNISNKMNIYLEEQVINKNKDNNSVKNDEKNILPNQEIHLENQMPISLKDEKNNLIKETNIQKSIENKKPLKELNRENLKPNPIIHKNILTKPENQLTNVIVSEEFPLREDINKDIYKITNQEETFFIQKSESKSSYASIENITTNINPFYQHIKSINRKELRIYDQENYKIQKHKDIDYLKVIFNTCPLFEEGEALVTINKNMQNCKRDQNSIIIGTFDLFSIEIEGCEFDDLKSDLKYIFCYINNKNYYIDDNDRQNSTSGINMYINDFNILTKELYIRGYKMVFKKVNTKYINYKSIIRDISMFRKQTDHFVLDACVTILENLALFSTDNTNSLTIFNQYQRINGKIKEEIKFKGNIYLLIKENVYPDIKLIYQGNGKNHPVLTNESFLLSIYLIEPNEYNAKLNQIEKIFEKIEKHSKQNNLRFEYRMEIIFRDKNLETDDIIEDAFKTIEAKMSDYIGNSKVVYMEDFNRPFFQDIIQLLKTDDIEKIYYFQKLLINFFTGKAIFKDCYKYINDSNKISESFQKGKEFIKNQILLRKIDDWQMKKLDSVKAIEDHMKMNFEKMNAEIKNEKYYLNLSYPKIHLDDFITNLKIKFHFEDDKINQIKGILKNYTYVKKMDKKKKLLITTYQITDDIDDEFNDKDVNKESNEKDKMIHKYKDNKTVQNKEEDDLLEKEFIDKDDKQKKDESNKIINENKNLKEITINQEENDKIDKKTASCIVDLINKKFCETTSKFLKDIPKINENSYIDLKTWIIKIISITKIVKKSDFNDKVLYFIYNLLDSKQIKILYPIRTGKSVKNLNFKWEHPRKIKYQPNLKNN